jgi:UPF0176 protein
MDATSYKIIIFYKYTKISDPVGFMRWHKTFAEEHKLTGRVLIASEGINGTLEGSDEQIALYEAAIHAQDGSKGNFGNLSDVWFKESVGTGNAFPKMKVKVRDEIVTLGLGADDIDPNQITGTHLSPVELKQWFESGEEFEIIDMRNDYEYRVGHFKGSRDPGLENFRDLPKALPQLEPLKEKKVLTVCTYGVRCEKASGYLKQQGFKQVYQLNGGIGSYMKAFPGEDFLGSLFVFDNRLLERFTDNYPVCGVCQRCSATTENYSNCARPECHKKMLVCERCLEKEGKIWCSEDCRIHTRPVYNKVTN